MPLTVTAAADNDRFLARHSDYRSLLEHERVADAVRARLATARRMDDPFPLVWVEDLLPQRVYDVFDAAWPSPEFFAQDAHGTRGDLVLGAPDPAAPDKRRHGYTSIPTCLREVWESFTRLNREVIGPWVGEVFEPEISRRLALLTRWYEEHGAQKEHLAPPYAARMNVGRLMLRGPGYRLRPHVDAVSYLATVLTYFPEPAGRDDLGTTLYRVERELDPFELFVAGRGSTAYFEQAGIAVEPVRNVPFRANALLAFANTGRSAHGVQITASASWRRAFQSHLSIKSDAAGL